MRFSTEIEGKLCLVFLDTFFEEDLHKKQDSTCIEIEAACWSNFWVEISWIFYCKLVSDFYPEEIINSLSLCDRFFQGHWPKIIVCVEWRVDIYLLSVKKSSYSSVLILKIYCLFRVC